MKMKVTIHKNGDITITGTDVAKIAECYAALVTNQPATKVKPALFKDQFPEAHAEIVGMPSYPPVPEGYSHWEPRSTGWETDDQVRFAISDDGKTNWVAPNIFCRATGNPKVYYLEAVKLPTPQTDV